MPRPIRDRDPEKIHLVTIRTDEAAMWLNPSEELNETIGGIVARYQEILGITLYAYVFLSNHYHLLLNAPLQNLDEFAENVNREIARRVNWLNGRKANFWSRRYDDQIVPSEEDALEALIYIATNPTRHGLVSNPAQWPGLTCYEQILGGADRSFKFTQYSKFDELGRPIVTTHTLKVSPLPQFSGLTTVERTEILKARFLCKRKELCDSRSEAGKGFLGVAMIKKQEPGEMPREVSRSPRPVCYTKSKEIRKSYRVEVKAKRTQYIQASMRFRLGLLETQFPEYTHKPPLHRKPRFTAFQPIESLEKIAA